jgi:hypothetical protein
MTIPFSPDVDRQPVAKASTLTPLLACLTVR